MDHVFIHSFLNGHAFDCFVPSAGVDPPSSRDPPFPAAVSSSSHLTSSVLADMPASNLYKGSILIFILVLSNHTTTMIENFEEC